MSRLKSTIPALSSMIGETKTRGRWSYGFVFSSNIHDWMFADTPFGRARRRQYESDLRKNRVLSSTEPKVQKAA